MTLKTFLHLLLFFRLFASVSSSQVAPEAATDRSAEVARAIAGVKSGEVNGYFAEVIAEERLASEIPDLENMYLRATDPLEKAKVAQVLLYLGDKKDVYWDYLSELVRPALDPEIPDPALYDASGKHIPGLSKEFTAWAKAHGDSVEDAGGKAVYQLPGVVTLLGKTGDARAIPLLRRALASKNSMVAVAGAFGLVEMQDATSIPNMIQRCKVSHPDVARMIARSLIYFDDRDAQATADAYLPKEYAKGLREEKAAGRGALHRK